MISGAVFCALATAFLTLFLTSGVNGQVIRVGACPTPTLSRPQAAPAAPNFLSGDMRRVWYVVRHTRPVLGPQLVCRQFRFSLETPAVAPALQTILVDISGVNWFGKNITVHGEMSTTDTFFQTWSAEFRRLATTPSLVPRPSPYPTGYLVLGYDTAAMAPATPTWVVLYSCTAVGQFRVETVSILTPTRLPSSATITAATAVITAAGVTSSLTPAEQTVCVS